MSFFERVVGVFFNPRQTLEAVAEKPIWWDVLIVLLVSMSIYSALIMPLATRDALANYQTDTGTPPPDFSQMPKWILVIGAIAGLFSIMVMVFLTCGIIYLMGRMFSTAEIGLLLEVAYYVQFSSSTVNLTWHHLLGH